MARPKTVKTPTKVTLNLPLETRKRLFRLASKLGKSMSRLVTEMADELAARENV